MLGTVEKKSTKFKFALPLNAKPSLALSSPILKLAPPLNEAHSYNTTVSIVAVCEHTLDRMCVSVLVIHLKLIESCFLLSY